MPPHSKATLIPATLLAAALLAACQPQAPAPQTAPPAPAQDWQLAGFDGGPAPWPATLSLAQPGLVSGASPCNTYSGPVLNDAGTFRVGLLALTEMACAGDLMMGEATYMAALTAVNAAEFAPDRLVLTGGGHELVFSAAPLAQ